MTRKQKTAHTMQVFSEHGFLDLLGYKAVTDEVTDEVEFCVELPKGMLGNKGQFVRCTSFKKRRAHWHALVEKRDETEYGEVWAIEFLDEENIPDNVPDAPWMGEPPASGGDPDPTMTAPLPYNAVASEASVKLLTERVAELERQVKRLSDAAAGEAFAPPPEEKEPLPW